MENESEIFKLREGIDSYLEKEISTKKRVSICIFRNFILY